MKSARILVLVGAALLALLVVVVARVVSRESRSTDGPTAAPVAPAADAEQGSAEPRAPVGSAPRPAPARKVGRLRDAEQRRRLVEAIAAARELRRRIASERERAAAEDAAEDAAGTLSKQTIRDAVGAVIEDVKRCYDDQLARTPDLGGKLVVSFEIVAEEGAGGVVDSVEIADGSDAAISASRELTQCIVDTIYTLELPEPEGGGVVEVSYPFVMRPSAAAGE